MRVRVGFHGLVQELEKNELCTTFVGPSRTDSADILECIAIEDAIEGTHIFLTPFGEPDPDIGFLFNVAEIILFGY